jgi:HK97 family phage major capsid protein
MPSQKLQKMYDKSTKLDVKIVELEALETAGTITDEQKIELKNAQKEFTQVENDIRDLSDYENAKEQSKKPENKGWRPSATPNNEQFPHEFKNLTDQLIAVRSFAETGRMDDRLLKVNNAALGANEGTLVEGGFAIQQDIAGMLMESAAQAGDIMTRVDSYQISGRSNSMKWVEVQEDDISNTVFGGVRVYWAAEAGTVDPGKIKLQERELKLEKLLGFAYTTYEMDADSNFIDQLYQRAFQLAIRREIEASIVAGSGAGKPKGFTKSGALVTLAIEQGQNLTDTPILWKNLSKMFNRRLKLPGSKYVWLCHPDMLELFDFIEFPVGVGGVPVYLQETKEGSLSTIKSLPIVECDACSQIGTVGDIMCTDLNDYALIYKGGVDSADSIHVEFLTAQRCYRFIFRANGMPKTSSSLTIKNSSNKRSPVTTLAART